MKIGEYYEIEVAPNKGPRSFYSKGRVISHDPKGTTVVSYIVGGQHRRDEFKSSDILHMSLIK